MIDGKSRTIDYLRISVTDRCNLRCVYCMPEKGVEWMPHEAVLRYEDILRLCRVFAGLGVTKYKITGGEPLVRKGLDTLISGIKAIPGAESVTITTNGALLKEQLPALLEAGLDGVNISLDTLDPARYQELTRRDELKAVMGSLKAALGAPGLNVKINCVPTGDRSRDWLELAALAREERAAVRFIELMPLGLGRSLASCTEAEIRRLLEKEYGPMAPFVGKLGNGPCRYFTVPGFLGKIGFISAMSHQFCHQCNRVRLTAGGFLKTCLQYNEGIELSPLLKGSDRQLREAIRAAIYRKPGAHQFAAGAGAGLEGHLMNQIGG
ncbi:MAG: GTP 3',8-cyclase MoaA [Clostridium sp.]|nr:GTP 3',8-cyclase MoaA [Clostridium sp.]